MNYKCIYLQIIIMETKKKTLCPQCYVRGNELANILEV